MNWGSKIFFVYIFFIAGILFMVFKSANQKTDLVTTDYYARELKYQEKIDEMGRVSALSAPVTYVVKDDELIVTFPKDFDGKKLTGEVLLYCPSDENKDIKQIFSLQDELLKLKIPAINKRLFQLQLTWRQGEATYYFEKKIFI